MLERVAKTITRYSMIEPGQKIGVAVSGGADSVCLLYLLSELAARWELALRVLHVDHQLRGEESRGDADFVRELAGRLGLPFHSLRCDVRRISEEKGDNLEQAARRVRREFFLSAIREGLADRVALGHTRSDQAETVLFRFLRGSGTAGLAGIRPVTSEGFIRPLLEVSRSEVEEYLRERSIPWRVDSTNFDLSVARNRIRHELLPMLARDWNPALVDTLAQTAELARDEEEYWQAEVDRLSRDLKVRGETAVLEAGVVRRLPRAAARRLLRRAIEHARGNLRRIGFGHVEEILRLAGSEEGHGRLQIPGVDVFRSFEWIRFAPAGRENLENRNYRLALTAPGRYRIPVTGTSIILELLEVAAQEEKDPSGASGYNTEGSDLDWGRISGALELRNWRPGDQYRPLGHTAEAKIKLLFQEARIPLWERRKWPIITSGNAIVWVRQFGPAADYAATPASRTVLKVREVVEDSPEN